MEGKREQPTRRVNYARRALGAAVCLTPAALLLASLAVGIANRWESWWGLGITLAGLLVGGVNLYLALLRPALYAWRHGSKEGLRNISGLPLLGTLLATTGGAVGFGDWRTATVGLVTLAIDVGGLPWFLAATWRDGSFWDG